MKEFRSLCGIILLSLTHAAPAAAEVMDKMPAPAEVWAWGALGAILGLVVGRYWPYLGFVSLLLGVYVPFGTLTEVLDPAIGRAVLHEAGGEYTIQVYGAFLAVVLGHAFGMLFHVRHRRRTRQSTTAA